MFTLLVGLALGWVGATATSQRHCGRLLAGATYLGEAASIRFDLALIRMAEAAGDTRIVAALEERSKISVIALQGFGIDSSRSNREIVVSILQALSDYQAKAHGRVDPELASLLKRIKE